MNEFELWVRDQGSIIALAKRLRVTRGCIYRWLNKKSCPTVPTIGELIRISNGQLDFEKIVEGCTPNKKRSSTSGRKNGGIIA